MGPFLALLLLVLSRLFPLGSVTKGIGIGDQRKSLCLCLCLTSETDPPTLGVIGETVPRWPLSASVGLPFLYPPLCPMHGTPLAAFHPERP